jgi:hypothetical protein
VLSLASNQFEGVGGSPSAPRNLRSFAELRYIIESSPRRLSTGFAEALIEHALGRPVGFTDQALTQQMVQTAERRNFLITDYRFALVNSREFQSK